MKFYERKIVFFSYPSIQTCMLGAQKNRFIETFLLSTHNIIQLMHSFEVDIRICQPENSDVHRGEAEVNITFEG